MFEDMANFWSQDMAVSIKLSLGIQAQQYMALGKPENCRDSTQRFSVAKATLHSQMSVH